MPPDTTQPNPIGIAILAIACMLQVLFIGLKLTQYIDWSWWFIVAPAWGYSVLQVICHGASALSDYLDK